MRLRRLFVVAIFPAIAGAQVAENSALRIEIWPDTGSIVRLYDKRNNTEYVTDRNKARLFELLIPDATNDSRRIVSWTNRPASISASAGTVEIAMRSCARNRSSTASAPRGCAM